MKPEIPLEDDAVMLARRLASRLIAVKGVAAVALGGSHARGTASAESDVDLGIYYHARRPPSLEALRRLAAELHDEQRRGAVKDFGKWGGWHRNPDPSASRQLHRTRTLAVLPLAKLED